MKKYALLIAVAFTGLTFLNPVVAQDSAANLKALQKKAIKIARNEAKKNEKAGYRVAPGALPMSLQLEKSYLKEMETDDAGNKRFYTSTRTAVAESQIAAVMQATEAARLDIAGQISSEVAAMINSNIANQQLNAEDAASVTKIVAASKTIVAQQLGSVVPVFEMYKKIDKNIEANVRLAYDRNIAVENTKKAIREKLEAETNLVKDQVDKLLTK